MIGLNSFTCVIFNDYRDKIWLLEFQHRVNTNAGCANTIAASGLSMAGTNFIQIGGAVTSSEFSGDTFCGSVLSSFVLDRALGPDAAGALVPTAVIGE